MAPSPDKIFEIFSQIGPRGGKFMDHVDPKVQFHVTGHQHSIKGSHESHEAVSDLFDSLDFIDWDCIEVKPRKVIGGCQSEWACVEMTTRGKAKKDKEIANEFVYIVHFNDANKIDVVRLYCDTAEVNDHVHHHAHN